MSTQATDQFCLKWNNYQSSLSTAFKAIRDDQDFVDVTLTSAEGTFKAHKVVLSACSNYFKDLLKGISIWQHPVLMLKDIPHQDLEDILEFVYLGQVNVNQENLQSFLKSAEILRIKGLTEENKQKGVSANKRDYQSVSSKDVRSTPSAKKLKAAPAAPAMIPDRPKPIITKNDNAHFPPASTSSSELPEVKNEPPEDESEPEIDKMDLYRNENNDSEEHIMVHADPNMMPAVENLEDIENQSSSDPSTVMKPSLHKRCQYCNVVLLRKNMSRHIRDQHTPHERAKCPSCTKTYKTIEWLKDHMRRGHRYTKEECDTLLAEVKAKEEPPVMETAMADA